MHLSSNSLTLALQDTSPISAPTPHMFPPDGIEPLKSCYAIDSILDLSMFGLLDVSQRRLPLSDLSSLAQMKWTRHGK